MFALLVFTVFALSASPALSVENHPVAQKTKCFSLKKDKIVCGHESIFKNKKDRDNIVSVFSTLSVTVDLPAISYLYMTSNLLGDSILWVEEKDQYVMGKGKSVEEAVNQLAKNIRSKEKKLKPRPSDEKDECFRVGSEKLCV